MAGAMAWKSGRLGAVLMMAAAAMLGACRTEAPGSITGHLFSDNTKEAFLYCGGEGCAVGHTLRFEGADWSQVRALFDPASPDSETERQQIADAVALMETIAGRQAGTSGDLAGTTWLTDSPDQLDCYSEAVNTTNFLGLLEREGLLRRHQTLQPELRGLLEYGRGGLLTHATASVEDRATGERFAVDSWYFDNGKAPSIVPLDEWLDGWSPDETGA